MKHRVVMPLAQPHSTIGIVILVSIRSHPCGDGPGPHLGQHLFAESGLPWPRGWVRGWVRRNGHYTTVQTVLASLTILEYIGTLSSSPTQEKTGRRWTSNSTVREPARLGRDGKSRVCRTSEYSLQRIVSWLSPARPAGHDGSSCSLSGQRPWTRMLRGSYSLDGDGQPCSPCSRQPSYSSPRQHPRPPTTLPFRARPQLVKSVRTTVRASASRRLLTKPAAYLCPTTLTHVPLLSSAETLLQDPLFLP